MNIGKLTSNSVPLLFPCTFQTDKNAILEYRLYFCENNEVKKMVKINTEVA